MSDLVSARTGVAGSTEIVAVTRFGCSGSRSTAVTAPTRMPLNSTPAPRRQPRHRLLEAEIVDGALAEAADILDPVDEPEARKQASSAKAPIRT